MFEKIWHFFHQGGIFMVPIVFCSVLSLAIILERGLFLRRSKIIPDELCDSISEFKPGADPIGLQNYVRHGDSTLARLVRVCLVHLPWTKAENVEALQTQARTEISRLERGLVVLEIITGIGPMLGLLGTVSGLAVIFSELGGASLSTQGLVIAKGIAEALNTTVAGLVVAIPSLIAHSYYTKKIEAMSVEMESYCMDLLSRLYLHRDTSEGDA
jgi:biopolymer transport protein ExbB